MTNGVQGTAAAAVGASDMPMTSGMEHPTITLGALPLVSPRVLTQFCQAIQLYADGVGFHDDAAAGIGSLRSRLTNLTNLAQLSRMAVVGVPDSFARLRDELTCIAVDFPADPVPAPGTSNLPDDAPDLRVQLGPVFDLLAGAAFVSKDEPALHDFLVTGVIRAVEDAICYPLAYSAEAATYLSGSSAKLVRGQAELVIANATQRLIERDYRCNPLVPAHIRRRLELMARDWMCANPVTAMFAALTGPQLDRIVEQATPRDVKPGDIVTLTLRQDCVDSPKILGSGEGEPESGGVFALFCPTQMAKVLGRGAGKVEVQVPAFARTGPVAVVRQPALTDVEYLLRRYACAYPAEWSNCLFSVIPMWKWAYPTAFGPPVVQVTQIPVQADVTAYVASGPLSSVGQAVVDSPVYIHYQVDPPGSDGNVPLKVNASLGVANAATPGLVVYTPAQTGDDAVVLSWGGLSEVVHVHVVRPT
jgi:hypothetical protein